MKTGYRKLYSFLSPILAVQILTLPLSGEVNGRRMMIGLCREDPQFSRYLLVQRNDDKAVGRNYAFSMISCYVDFVKMQKASVALASLEKLEPSKATSTAIEVGDDGVLGFVFSISRESPFVDSYLSLSVDLVAARILADKLQANRDELLGEGQQGFVSVYLGAKKEAVEWVVKHVRGGLWEWLRQEAIDRDAAEWVKRWESIFKSENLLKKEYENEAIRAYKGLMLQ